MNGKKSNYNMQSSLAEENTIEEQRKQTEKAKQIKKYRMMTMALIFIIVITGALFVKSIWSGWAGFLGNKYYYINGDKVIGLTTIDNEQYFFNDSGVMQTGWQTILGKNYYFNDDGVGQCGFQTIDGKKYFFDDDGILHTGWLVYNNKTYYCASRNNGEIATGKWEINGDNYYFDYDGIMATGSVEIVPNEVYYFDDNGHFEYCDITKESLQVSMSEKQVSFSNRGGGKAWGHYNILNKPLENVISLKGSLMIWEMDYGNGNGQWQMHVRNSKGKWKRIGFFNVKDEIGEFEYYFDDPISFDAYVCTGYESRNWSGTMLYSIKTVICRSYDYGTDVYTE